MAITVSVEFSTRDRIYKIICNGCGYRDEVRYSVDEMTESGMPEISWQELKKRLLERL
jgi:hypothetical protein